MDAAEGPRPSLSNEQVNELVWIAFDPVKVLPALGKQCKCIETSSSTEIPSGSLKP
jgi:hypothetical protein